MSFVDRIVFALPRNPAGTITLTAAAAVMLLAVSVYAIGWPLTCGALVMGAAGAARCAIASGWWS